MSVLYYESAQMHCQNIKAMSKVCFDSPNDRRTGLTIKL